MEQDEENRHFCQRLCQLYVQFAGKTYCLDEIRKISSESEHLLIYGAGLYAGILAEELEYNNIPYDGFVVTRLNRYLTDYREKSVYELSDQPFDCEKLGVLIGIEPGAYYDLKENLEKHHISRFFAPFLLKK